MRKNFLLVCMPKLESRASAGRMKSGKGPASWGDPSQGWGYDHGGGQKEAPCLEEDLSFIKVMGQDLCGLWDQPTLSLTSPVCLRPLSITGFSVHFTCSFRIPRLTKLVSSSSRVLLLLLLPGTPCPLNLTWLAASQHSGFSWGVTSSSERFLS